jgi:exocyst complex component 1
MGISFKQEPPKVQITRTATDEVEAPAESQAERAESPDKSRSGSPGTQAEKRRKRKSDNSAKYLNALGIDPTILEGRATEFDSVLTELGWNGRLNESKRVEELEADVRREIGRAQAGSWLGHMEQQEGKIDQLSKMFDRCMEECEELDGLLTLYAHELNVRTFILPRSCQAWKLTMGRH